jgi:hypothetical protein
MELWEVTLNKRETLQIAQTFQVVVEGGDMIVRHIYDRVSLLILSAIRRLYHLSLSCDTKRLLAIHIGRRGKHSKSTYDLAPQASIVFAEDELCEQNDLSCKTYDSMDEEPSNVVDLCEWKRKLPHSSKRSSMATQVRTYDEAKALFESATKALQGMDLHTQPRRSME